MARNLAEAGVGATAAPQPHLRFAERRAALRVWHTVFRSLQQAWHSLKTGTPGRRFQDRYERSAARKGQHVVWRISKLLIALALILVGLVEIVFPGPAVLFFFVAGALLADESRTVARAMDWAEVKFRRTSRAVRRTWHRMSWSVRSVILIGAAAATAAGSYAAFQVIAD